MKRIVLVAMVLICSPLARAENWGQWRGPNSNGSSPETNLPESFSLDDAEKKTKQKNVAWICDLPGDSNATPVVFGDKAYVTSNNSEHNELSGICVSVKTGKILWQKAIVKVSPKEVSGTHKNTNASPSAVTDGKQVAFTFGTGDIACFDTEGKPLWARNIPKDHGEFTYLHGYSSTPLLYKDKLYVQVLRRDRPEAKGGKTADPNYGSYLLALDWKTGKDIFKAPRKSDAKDGECESYSSPVLYERPGRTEILISGSLWVSGHNPETGKEYWHWGTLTPVITGNVRSVSEPVANNDFIFAGGPRKRPFFAIKAGGTGDLSKDGMAWEFKDHDCAVPSPLLYDNYLYLLDDDKKKMSCLEPTTGKVKWAGTLDSPDDRAGFSSSPAAADGKIYCMNERGNIVILASQEFKVLCRVNVNENGFTASSPVIAEGHVFFRTPNRLICIGK